MTVYRPDRRDPLTQRFARSIAETRDDPYAYSEGTSEPTLVDPQAPEDLVDRMLRRWGPVALLLLVVAITAGWLG